MVIRTGRRRVISAMCAELRPHVRPLSGTPAGGRRPDREMAFRRAERGRHRGLQSEAGLRGMFLDDNEVPGIAAGPDRCCRCDRESDEVDVGLHLAVENREDVGGRARWRPGQRGRQIDDGVRVSAAANCCAAAIRTVRRANSAAPCRAHVRGFFADRRCRWETAVPLSVPQKCLKYVPCWSVGNPRHRSSRAISTFSPIM